MTTTPNMGLTYVYAGTNPFEWGVSINANFLIMEDHNHASGSGVTISSLNINFLRDFDFSIYFSNTGYLNFYDQTSTSDVSTNIPASTGNLLYVYSGDSYFIDGNFKSIPLTSNGSLSIGSATGFGFTGTYASSSAVATYSESTQTYSFFDGSDTLSILQCNKSNFVSFTAAGAMVCLSLDVSSSVSASSIDMNLPTSGSYEIGLAYNLTTSCIYTSILTNTHFVRETSSSTTNTFDCLRNPTSIDYDYTSNLRFICSNSYSGLNIVNVLYIPSSQLLSDAEACGYIPMVLQSCYLTYTNIITPIYSTIYSVTNSSSSDCNMFLSILGRPTYDTTFSSTGIYNYYVGTNASKSCCSLNQDPFSGTNPNTVNNPGSTIYSVGLPNLYSIGSQTSEYLFIGDVKIPTSFGG